MNTEAIIKAMLAQREFWVDLDAGKRVKLRRPAEMDVVRMLTKDASGAYAGIAAGLSEVVRFAVDWAGFCESDLIGAAGASDPVPFATDLWEIMIADQAAWCTKCASALVESIVAHEKKAADAAGN